MAATSKIHWGMRSLARGGSSPISLAATLIGKGSIQGSFNQLVLVATPYGIERVDYPWGTINEWIFGAAGLIGEITGVVVYVPPDPNPHSGYGRHRAFFKFAIPGGITIKYAALLANGNFTGTPIIDYFVKPLCSDPPIMSDWYNVNTGAYLGSVSVGGFPAVRPVPIGALTAGANNYISAASEDDLSDISAGDSRIYNLGADLLLAW